MKRHAPLLTTILFVSATALAAQSQAPPRTKPDQPTNAPKASHAEPHAKGDLDFAKKVAAGGHAEIDLAKIAEQKSSSNEVKMLASRIQTDHMKANDELTRIASQKGWDLPTEPTPDQKGTKARLEKLNGVEFDKEYTALMVKNHRDNIGAFQREASKGADPDLKQFASKTLPTLKEHLDLAEKAQRAVGGQRAAR